MIIPLIILLSTASIYKNRSEAKNTPFFLKFIRILEYQTMCIGIICINSTNKNANNSPMGN